MIDVVDFQIRETRSGKEEVFGSRESRVCWSSRRRNVNCDFYSFFLFCFSNSTGKMKSCGDIRSLYVDEQFHCKTCTFQIDLA